MISKIKAAVLVTAVFLAAIFWAIIERMRISGLKAQKRGLELRQSAEMKAIRKRQRVHQKYDDLAAHWIEEMKRSKEKQAAQIEEIEKNPQTAKDRFNAYTQKKSGGDV